MAVVIPFPIDRRGAFIRRQAQVASELNSDTADRYIEQQLRLQRDAMSRQGVQSSLIDRELAILERAIRSALWSEILTPRGG